MNCIIPLLTLFTLVFVDLLPASELDDLIGRLKTSTQSWSGVGGDDEQIAARLQKIGAPAIPYLLPLLDDPSESVRNLTAYTLRDIPGLTEKDLPPLMASQLREEGWISPAIARIGTPEAVTFLVDELVRTREDAGQINYAIKILGPKAIPELVGIYRRNLVWDLELNRAMYTTFHDMGKDALPAVAPLLQIAEDHSASLDQRVHALQALGAIGITSSSAVPALLELRRSDISEIREASSSAIKNIGTSDATSLFLEDLRATVNPRDKVYTVTAIARLGARGKSAGPILSEYLDSPDWDLRLEAALALGYIGDEKSADKLIPLLDNQEDWRLVFAAARSLSLLQVKAALPRLQTLSNTHWYPPVRQEAKRALQAIQAGTKPKQSMDEPYYEFYRTLHAYEDGMDRMRMMSPSMLPTGAYQYFRAPLLPSATKVLKRQDTGALKYEELNGTYVKGGFLVGIDRGEWGGEITFIDPLGGAHVLSSQNTKAIYRTNEGAIAISGLAHMSINEGLVYKLHPNSVGQWVSEKWRALPGAPTFSRRLKDGSLLIVCSGGSVLLSPNGDLQFLFPSDAIAKLRPTTCEPLQEELKISGPATP